jgi:putative hydrolase of the HAD superfamily
MKKYKQIIFDLDNTLWNFEKNSKESLLQVYTKHKLDQKFESFEKFFEIYETYNLDLWDQYRKGLIAKFALGLNRFAKTLATVNIFEDEFAQKLNTEYLANTTTKTELIPHAFEILLYLKDKYLMHILTNGFFEVQFLKLRNSKLETFFQNLITSEEAGALKPSPKIYKYALDKIIAQPEECIIIGDNYEIDIIGAQNVGIDQIFFNSKNVEIHGDKPTFIVNSLDEIKNIL